LIIHLFSVMFDVVRAVHKFDFTLVIKETFKKVAISGRK